MQPADNYYRLAIERDLETNAPIFKVPCPDVTRHFRFSPRLQAMTLCTGFIEAADLRPEYTIWSEPLQHRVLFAHNRVTRRVEQFVVDAEEVRQVKETDSGLRYDVRKRVVEKVEEDPVTNSNKPVKMLTPSQESDESPEVEFKVHEFVLYIHHNQEEFKFQFDTTRMEFVKADHAADLVTEHRLFPRYSEYSVLLNIPVIHAWNSGTEKFEQYGFCGATRGFEQLENTGLTIDGEKRMKGTVLFTVTATQTSNTMVVMVDASGRLRKEEYCRMEGEFRELAPRPVRTLMVKRKEAMEKASGQPKTSEKDKELPKCRRSLFHSSTTQKTSGNGEAMNKMVSEMNESNESVLSLQKPSTLNKIMDDLNEMERARETWPATIQKTSGNGKDDVSKILRDHLDEMDKVVEEMKERKTRSEKAATIQKPHEVSQAKPSTSEPYLGIAREIKPTVFRRLNPIPSPPSDDEWEHVAKDGGAPKGE